MGQVWPIILQDKKGLKKEEIYKKIPSFFNIIPEKLILTGYFYLGLLFVERTAPRTGNQHGSTER